jgi:hypothetical protein
MWREGIAEILPHDVQVELLTVERSRNMHGIEIDIFDEAVAALGNRIFRPDLDASGTMPETFLY